MVLKNVPSTPIPQTNLAKDRIGLLGGGDSLPTHSGQRGLARPADSPWGNKV